MTRRPVPTARLAGLVPSDRGLTSDEVRERRERHGPNAILEAPPDRWRDLARDTLRDPMIWFLAGVSALYGGLGEIREALVLLAAVVPLVGMDAFLHRRTQASTEGLRGRLAERATVVRDGREVEVPAVEVVPGDLAVVRASEPFPADGIVVGGADMQADESSLTGEAYPVPKRPLPAPPTDGEEPPVDAEHWGFAGTRLLTGRALLRVAFTGGETLYGQIVRSAVGGARARTPLQGAIANLATVLLAAASVICLVLAVVRLGQGYGWVDALVSAVTLATAAIPEEFPVVFTFFLGVGVYRLARRQALVRRAVAVENIGRITAVCSDKTGTITAGRLHLAHLVAAEGVADERLLALAALASRRDSGDPMDAAVLRAAEAAGARKTGLRALATFPFTETRKRETAIVREPDGTITAVTKGAAETVLDMVSLGPDERRAWSARVAALSGEGHRVIACAWRALDEDVWTGDELEEGYRLAGLLAFEDPVREGVAQAIDVCRGAGIHAVMVTGDHPLTARAVAREVGLGGGSPVVITGEDLEAMVARGATADLRRVDVVARATPAQKLALVRALQEAGEIVAVTGDGVNDVPALQAADIGVAMGERGTRSAREAAAIVLMDDNFRTIVGAVAEGRQLFRNLRLAFEYLLMVHIPFVLSALVVPLAGYPLLYLPVHIVWIELVIHPTALLVFQELPAAGLERRRAAARFFSRAEWAVIGAVGGILAGLVVGGYVRNVEEHGAVEYGRTLALAVLLLASAGLIAALTGLGTWPARAVAGATVASTLVFVQTPALARALHLEPLHLADWIIAAAAAGVAIAAPLAGRWLSGRRAVSSPARA